MGKIREFWNNGQNLRIWKKGGKSDRKSGNFKTKQIRKDGLFNLFHNKRITEMMLYMIKVYLFYETILTLLYMSNFAIF